jgi:hypothetical protein
MNEQAQALWRKAEECESAAQRAHEEAIRRAYLDLARQWQTTREYVTSLQCHSIDESGPPGLHTEKRKG